MDLGHMLEESTRRFTERIALIHDGNNLTYRDLNRAVNALAGGLRDLGIGKDDKVAILLPNIPEFVIAYLAAQKLGAVAVTLNVMSTAFELRHLLGNSDSKAFITTASAARRFEEIRDEMPLCRHLLVTDSADSPYAWSTLVSKGGDDFPIPAIGDDDSAVMIYTSGLTGRPVGAVLTHGNLQSQTGLLASEVAGTEEDRCLAIIPFFHSFGAVANMLAPLRTGASIVLMDRFTLDGIFTAIEREKVTYITGVPRLFLGMIFHDKADSYDVSSLRFCITGGAAIPPDVFTAFESKFKVKLVEGYGLTEASPICTLSRIDRPHRPGSIGTVIPGLQAKIVDKDGREVPRGQVGELIVRGPNVMKGYYKDSTRTAEVIRDGWLHTSDLGTMDGDGYIFLTGHAKRMVITSGFNVYPREIELVLEMHPAVRQAKITGKQDLMRGEIVKASIVLKPGATAGEKDILRHCRTYLSNYKHPREIEFVEAIDEA
ncbi:MAG: long-chain fatty acid--CoA ligase [Syntrophaceae bacterium]|nr:long-chain fatty acid--CoA ligase [Syntrophaceae bacterium]